MKNGLDREGLDKFSVLGRGFFGSPAPDSRSSRRIGFGAGVSGSVSEELGGGGGGGGGCLRLDKGHCGRRSMSPATPPLEDTLATRPLEALQGHTQAKGLCQLAAGPLTRGLECK